MYYMSCVYVSYKLVSIYVGVLLVIFLAFTGNKVLQLHQDMSWHNYSITPQRGNQSFSVGASVSTVYETKVLLTDCLDSLTVHINL